MYLARILILHKKFICLHENAGSFLVLRWDFFFLLTISTRHIDFLLFRQSHQVDWHEPAASMCLKVPWARGEWQDAKQQRKNLPSCYEHWAHHPPLGYPNIARLEPLGAITFVRAWFNWPDLTTFLFLLLHQIHGSIKSCSPKILHSILKYRSAHLFNLPAHPFNLSQIIFYW